MNFLIAISNKVIGTYRAADGGRPSIVPQHWVPSQFVAPKVATSGFDFEVVN